MTARGRSSILGNGYTMYYIGKKRRHVIKIRTCVNETKQAFVLLHPSLLYHYVLFYFSKWATRLQRYVIF